LHVDEVVSQIGVAPEQSALDKHPTQIFCVLSQSGVAPGQSALVRHATHWFATVSQTGAAGLVQSLLTEQVTHVPAFIPVVTHEGPPGLPAQSASDMQARHLCEVVSHVGNIPLQSELNSQLTQAPVG
jgi:hypothetical protein